MNAQVLSRTLLAYGIALPLALLVGLVLTDPEEATNAALLGTVSILMILPLLLRHWHPMLFFFWNSSLIMGWVSSSAEFRFAAAAFGFAGRGGPGAHGRARVAPDWRCPGHTRIDRAAVDRWGGQPAGV